MRLLRHSVFALLALGLVARAADRGRPPRRKPKGFKHLEIHLRQSRRRLDDMARPLPYEDRRPIEEAIEDLEELRLKLLGDLMQEDRKGSNGPERKPQ